MGSLRVCSTNASGLLGFQNRTRPPPAHVQGGSASLSHTRWTERPRLCRHRAFVCTTSTGFFQRREFFFVIPGLCCCNRGLLLSCAAVCLCLFFFSWWFCAVCHTLARLASWVLWGREACSFRRTPNASPAGQNTGSVALCSCPFSISWYIALLHVCNM